MKKFFKALLTISLLLSLVACGNDSDSNPSTTGQSGIPSSEGESLNTEEETTESEEELNKVQTYWISGSTVNFRKSPSTKGELIGQLSKGTQILKLDEEGDWLYISYGDTEGYIHGDYASKYPPVNLENGPVSIVVRKGARLLELWQNEAMLISFPIGLGWAPEGHKQVEGDGKTPEGEYYVCVRNTNSAFYLSLGVSYPNKEDAQAALEDGRIDRNTHDRIVRAINNGQCPDWNTPLGGAIMIHGHGGSSDWTAGCIAVDNDVMDFLFECCPMRTKITILP